MSERGGESVKSKVDRNRTWSWMQEMDRGIVGTLNGEYLREKERMEDTMARCNALSFVGKRERGKRTYEGTWKRKVVCIHHLLIIEGDCFST
jgi:hypothetical protein